MARAFLSDRSGRAITRFVSHVHALGPLADPHNYAYCTLLEQRDVAAAESEARAILAETEGRPYEVERPVMIGFDVYPFETEIMAGLAESLALFLGQTFAGEPCRCAQGHHWSPERGYFDCGGVVA
jgi:hypothetical protein